MRANGKDHQRLKAIRCILWLCSPFIFGLPFHPEKQLQISQNCVRVNGEKDLFTVMMCCDFIVFFWSAPIGDL